MTLNYVSSISIVFLNKLAYQNGFPSMTLTLVHFLTTFLGLRVSVDVDQKRLYESDFMAFIIPDRFCLPTAVCRLWYFYD